MELPYSLSFGPGNLCLVVPAYFHHLISPKKILRTWWRIGRVMCHKVMPAILFMFSSHLLSFPIAFGGFATSRPFVVADDFVQPIACPCWWFMYFWNTLLLAFRGCWQTLACKNEYAEIKNSNGIYRATDGLPCLHRHSCGGHNNPPWYLLEGPQTRSHEEIDAAKEPWFRWNESWPITVDELILLSSHVSNTALHFSFWLT